MRIAIFGAGGVGGYYGARLAQAGEDVTFIARGRQLDALRAGGIALESIAGDVAHDSVRATDDPAEVGEVDAVLVATKAWQVAEAGPALEPLVGPDTAVVPLQNGVEAAAELEAVLGEGPVVGGLTRIISFVAEPGLIRHTGMDPTIVVGDRPGTSPGRSRPIADALGRAPGVSVEVVDDVESAVWRKFVFICSWSGVGAVTRMPLGPVRTTPGSRRLLVECMDEIVQVGLAHGVALPLSLPTEVMEFMDGLPPAATASMQRDVAAGRPSELEHQNGAVVRLGGERDVPTPVNAFLRDALVPAEAAARAAASAPPATR